MTMSKARKNDVESDKKKTLKTTIKWKQKNYPVVNKLDYYLAYDTSDHRKPPPNLPLPIRHCTWTNSTTPSGSNHTPQVLNELDYPLAYDTSDHPIRSQTKKGRKNDDVERDEK